MNFKIKYFQRSNIKIYPKTWLFCKRAIQLNCAQPITVVKVHSNQSHTILDLLLLPLENFFLRA